MLTKSKNIVKFILTLHLCIMSYYLYTHPYYNADIEAYMGLVYKAKYPNMKIEDIHKKVYDELKSKKPETGKVNIGREEEAAGDNSYYHILSENPKAYEEELQFFTVKPFYNFINSLFFRIGFEASTATFLITIISYILTLILIFIFLLNVLKNHYLSLLFTIALSLFKPLLDTSRHATPDGLSTFLLLLTFYYAVVKRNLFATAISGMLCILTRPEYFIFYSFLMALLFLFRKDFGFRRREITFTLIYFALTFGLIQYFNRIPWPVLFMNQFTQVQIYPISAPDPFSFHDYLRCIKGKLLIEFNSSYFPLLLIFIVMILDHKALMKRSRYSLAYAGLYIAIYLTVILRFFMFPTLVNRMMVGFYLLIILSLIAYQQRKNKIIEKTV